MRLYVGFARLRRPGGGPSAGGMAVTGRVFLGRELDGDLVLQVDMVAAGTGAGGSMALRQLALAGLDVVALEEGAYLSSRNFLINGRTT